MEAAGEAVAARGVRVVSLTADSTDDTALRAALDTAAEERGPPEVVVYIAALIQADAVSEPPARSHLDAWSVNVVAPAHRRGAPRAGDGPPWLRASWIAANTPVNGGPRAGMPRRHAEPR